jgi:glycosyltransferase involved in cell wall biosynthesis
MIRSFITEPSAKAGTSYTPADAADASTAKSSALRVLMVTCEWPTPDRPIWVPFLVRQVDFLRRTGVDIDVFFFRGARNPLNYLRAWWHVRRKLRKGGYDLIHAQWGQSVPTVLPTRLPLVVTFRGGEGEGIVGDHGRYTFSGYVLRLVSWVAARRADELVLVSSHMRSYVPKRRVHIIPSGLDFDRLPLIPKLEARRQLGLSESKRLVLFVGNPAEARKRHGLAQAVVSRLDSRLDAELVVAWRVPHALVATYMNACDALLFVSMYEGSPNVVKEALACNLPVVSVAVGDVPERLRDVPGCRLVSTDDPDALASALNEVLATGARTHSRDSVQDLDENVLAQRTLNVYRTAMNARRDRVSPATSDRPIVSGSFAADEEARR